MFGMHTTRVFIYIQRQFTAEFDRSINNKTPQSETETDKFILLIKRRKKIVQKTVYI
jgi:hypothetical protein